MIQVASNILSKDETLKKTDLEYLFRSLINPKPEIANRIRQLRLIRTLNAKQYSLLKRQLPYFVCGIFSPPFRKTENFAYTEYFIIDIDHIAEKGLDIDNVRTELQSDSRTVLCFISPSEDGLKLIFRLKERCYDAGLFSLFYKAFITKFSNQYHLEQIVDAKTCDVTRACFISIDSNAYFNPCAEAIDLSVFVNTDDPESISALKRKLKGNKQVEKKDCASELNQDSDPDEETMRKIRNLLNPKLERKLSQRPIYVPEVLEDMIDDLRKYIEGTGVIVDKITDIQYGKKISMSVGMKQAEINLFYGKRGFTVVKSPRCGTAPELNNLVADIISIFINER